MVYGDTYRWELPSNCPVFTVVVVIYHYVERIWRILVTLIYMDNIYGNKKYYPGEPANIHIRLLLNIIEDKNRVITTKEGKGKAPLFCGNGEQIIIIYGDTKV